MNRQASIVITRLKLLGDTAAALHAQRFFKTGPGEYGEGDRFLGIRVPVIRRCVKEWRDLSMEVVADLLISPFHEARLLALLILVERYANTAAMEMNAIYRFYLDHTKWINNWDLVDCSAEHIVGAHLHARDRRPLHRLARSRSLWERRIAILATFHFIKRREFGETLAIAERLLEDPEDLIHKAVGWMLREVGKRNPAVEEQFLAECYRRMPRTMLRYAIERMPEVKRQEYLRGTR